MVTIKRWPIEIKSIFESSLFQMLVKISWIKSLKKKKIGYVYIVIVRTFLFCLVKTKDVCHVWELGGGLVFKDLLSVIVEKTKGRRLSVVLVLDLSKPEALWTTMETFLEEVKNHMGTVPESEGCNQIDVQNTEVRPNLI